MNTGDDEEEDEKTEAKDRKEEEEQKDDDEAKERKEEEKGRRNRRHFAIILIFFHRFLCFSSYSFLLLQTLCLSVSLYVSPPFAATCPFGRQGSGSRISPSPARQRPRTQ